MKKVLVKLMSFVVISSCLVGCKKKNKSEEEGYKKKVKPTPEVIADKFIVQNSRTDYSVVIPKDPNEKEKMAAEAVASYLNKATGARVSIASDNEVSTSMHYISLGNTSLFRQEFSDVSMDALEGRISSYFVSTKGENIYIYSNANERGEGTLYGAYDLLHHLVDYEYYASDEIYYTNKTTVNLLNYKNFFIEPTFDGRSIGNYHLINNQDVCENLRVINQYKGNEWVSSIYGHSQVTQFVRPQDIYDGGPLYQTHPDWFSNPSATVADTDTNQLCWSAGDSLETYVANRFIKYFQDYKDATYFMFGQEDNANMFCNCDRCKKHMSEYAVNHAGLQIAFMNHVIAKTDAWLKENQPGRQVRYVVFGYYATKNAPCVEKDGTWVPANDQVIPNKNLYILYAPITCNFAYPLENKFFNSNTYLELKQWNAVAGGRVMVYFYDTNFTHYFSNFYNFSAVKAMYQTAQELGVSYLYTQGATDTNTAPFAYMREYVESKLMWDIDLDYEELVKDFTKHYFYEAGDDIYELYQTIRDRLAMYHAENSTGGSIYQNISNTKIYPYSVLRYLTNVIKNAMAKIEPYQTSNPDFYNTLKARIMREYLSIIYLKITLAKADMSEKEREEDKEIFKTYISYFAITRAGEGGTVIDVDTLFA